MNYIEKLNEMTKGIETKTEYSGYYYKVSNIITILAIGLLCSLKSAHEIYQWSCSRAVKPILLEILGTERLPCYAQFMNILGNIKVDSLDRIFMDWCKLIVENQLQDKTIAIDGKTIRTTGNMKSFESPLHIVSAYVSEFGMTIGQVAVNDKSNEIPATQALIELLNVKGAIVVADALNCQKKTAQAVIDGGGDYLLAVKENHKDLYHDIKLLFETEKAGMERFQKVEKSHGRQEIRTAIVTHDVDWYENKELWSGLSCFGAVRRVCEVNGNRSDEIRYYISNRKLSAEELLKYSRNEWGVESMHWMLDVIFNEDRTTLMEKDAQRTLNTLRKTALNLIRMYRDAFSPKSSLVGIMRDNLFDPYNIPQFFDQLAQIPVFWQS
jgi:predicted transposase YbfD/YdcC